MDVVVLPTSGLVSLERALLRFIEARTERERIALQNQKDSGRMAAMFGTPATVEADFTFDFQPIGAGPD